MNNNIKTGIYLTIVNF